MEICRMTKNKKAPEEFQKEPAGYQISTSTNIMVFVISCPVYNDNVIFENDVVYLYRLAQEAPFIYAKLALQENGLQNYVNTVTSLN